MEANLTRLIAVRHGETAWNVDTRIQGHLDIGLNATGLWQAQRAGQALADEPIAAVYASDLSRAWQTAQAIAEPHGLAVQPDLGLRERAFGRFEGMSFAEIEATLPEDARRWRERDPEFEPEGGGESLLTFRDRVTGTASAIAARHPGQLVVLVAHGGVMDVLYRAATRQELQAPRTWQLGNAAINRMLWTPEGFSLVGWSDIAHLATDSPLDETTT
ncbi:MULTISPECIES: histidine phosphatase family protein [unclassified Variovorax]|uniref:histidine phosphatase family protein n=1 Tax=unclassified Variovorax TaxID=663243 RepID=UPI0032E58CCE